MCNDNHLILKNEIIPNFSTSDHSGIHFTVDLNIRPLQTPIFRDYNRCDWIRIDALLLNVNWDLEFSTCQNIEEMYNAFLSIVHNIIETCVPLKKKNHTNTSMPTYIQKVFAKKHFLWKNISNQGLAAFRKCSRDCHKLCNKWARNREKRLIASGNRKSFFNYMKGRLRKKHSIGVLRTDDGDLIENDQDKCELFANFFQNTFKDDNNITPAFTPRTNKKLDIIKIDIETIRNTAKFLSNKLSKTPDDLPSRFIKKAIFGLSYPLCLLYRHSLVIGSLPTAWKTAIVSPLPKKPPHDDVKSYRPISLTSSVCKLLETIIKTRIMEHLTLTNTINKNQFGFLPGKSTVEQLISSFHEWFKGVSEKCQTEIVFVDFAKAFDTVIHNKLIYKLKSYGIDGEPLRWIRNFLIGRNFVVKINSSYSSMKPVISGVPQGSVLGPLFFLLYINDLPEQLNSSCRLFADDLKIYRVLHEPAIDFHILRNDLLKLENWSKAWQLDISAEKSHVMHINFMHECPLYLCDSVLPCENVVRDLGVYISSDLKWHQHCSYLYRKAGAVSNFILRSLQYKTLENFRLAYVVYCRPILEYCTPVWSPSTVVDKKLIEDVQRKYTKLAFRKTFPGPFQPSYKQRLAIFNIEILETRRLKQDLYLCYKIVKNTCCIKFNEMFAFTPFAKRSRQHPLQLLRTHALKNPIFDSYSHRVIRTWNHLPKQVVEAKTFLAFKQKLELIDWSAF